MLNVGLTGVNCLAVVEWLAGVKCSASVGYACCIGFKLLTETFWNEWAKADPA